MPDRETPKGWAAVPGTEEKAPIIDIVVFAVAALGVLAFAIAAVFTAVVSLADVMGAL